MKVGVVALQGAFAEHITSLRKCADEFKSLEVVEIRRSGELETCDGIIIPGGESTAMRIIGEKGDFFGALRRFISSGKPVWGTCAGCIILSDRVSSVLGGGSNTKDSHISTVSASELYGSSFVGGVDISTCRNFFGRQTKSFQENCVAACDKHSSAEVFNNFPAIFIRAPAIVNVGTHATPVAIITHNSEKIVVAAIHNNLLVTCFHPELTPDLRIHKYFLTLVQNRINH